MDYLFHQFQIEKSKIYLLEFNESFDPEKHLDTLNQVEKERYFSFLNPKRKKEFVATRLLKHALFGYQEIKYEAHGAPYIDDNEYISISHANHLVGIAVNLAHRVGFDIELIHSKVLKLHSKFLNETECSQHNLNSEKELIACWSMKETLYKLAGEKELDFKTQLNLTKTSPQEFLGEINLKSEKYFVDLHYFQFKNYIISVNKNQLTNVKK